MTREMTTLDLIHLLRKSRQSRSSWLPLWEDLARIHYRNLRSEWITSNRATLKDWINLENGATIFYAEDWLKFAYCQIMTQ